jgi:hypothetical protein
VASSIKADSSGIVLAEARPQTRLALTWGKLSGGVKRTKPAKGSQGHASFPAGWAKATKGGWGRRVTGWGLWLGRREFRVLGDNRAVGRGGGNIKKSIHELFFWLRSPLDAIHNSKKSVR